MRTLVLRVRNVVFASFEFASLTTFIDCGAVAQQVAEEVVALQYHNKKNRIPVVSTAYILRDCWIHADCDVMLASVGSFRPLFFHRLTTLPLVNRPAMEKGNQIEI